MSLACCFRKCDFTRCIPLYVVGIIFLAFGVSFVVAGIIGGFRYFDLFGYVGGISVFYGILFCFLWYMFTIPNPEMTKESINDQNSKKTLKKMEKTPTQNKESLAGQTNLGYERESSLPEYIGSVSIQASPSHTDHLLPFGRNKVEPVLLEKAGDQFNGRNKTRQFEIDDDEEDGILEDNPRFASTSNFFKIMTDDISEENF